MIFQSTSMTKHPFSSIVMLSRKKKSVFKKGQTVHAHILRLNDLYIQNDWMSVTIRNESLKTIYTNFWANTFCPGGKGSELSKYREYVQKCPHKIVSSHIMRHGQCDLRNTGLNSKYLWKQPTENTDLNVRELAKNSLKSLFRFPILDFLAIISRKQHVPIKKTHPIFHTELSKKQKVLSALFPTTVGIALPKRAVLNFPR